MRAYGTTDYEPGTGPVPDAYTYVGAVYVRGGERPLDIVDRVIELLGLPPKTPLKVRGRARAPPRRRTCP